MIKALQKLSKNIYRFYRYDCCWPYSVSFYLVLVIFWCEAIWIQNPSKWASISSYAILLFYYLYNRKLAKQNRIKDKRNLTFFLSFLGFKIFLWGIFLIKISFI